jgi:hypothetical protein
MFLRLLVYRLNNISESNLLYNLESFLIIGTLRAKDEFTSKSQKVGQQTLAEGNREKRNLLYSLVKNC